jgi:hypothetical protein
MKYTGSLRLFELALGLFDSGNFPKKQQPEIYFYLIFFGSPSTNGLKCNQRFFDTQFFFKFLELEVIRKIR